VSENRVYGWLGEPNSRQIREDLLKHLILPFGKWFARVGATGGSLGVLIFSRRGPKVPPALRARTIDVGFGGYGLGRLVLLRRRHKGTAKQGPFFFIVLGVRDQLEAGQILGTRNDRC